MLNNAEELVSTLQDILDCLQEAIEFGFDRSDNAGIVFKNIAGKRTLGRFIYENGNWLIKWNSDPSFNIPHHLLDQVAYAQLYNILYDLLS